MPFRRGSGRTRQLVDLQKLLTLPTNVRRLSTIEDREIDKLSSDGGKMDIVEGGAMIAEYCKEGVAVK